jgi:hypothetical protein
VEFDLSVTALSVVGEGGVYVNEAVGPAGSCEAPALVGSTRVQSSATRANAGLQQWLLEKRAERANAKAFLKSTDEPPQCAGL